MIKEVIVIGFAEQISAMRLCMQWRAHPYTVQWSELRNSVSRFTQAR